MKKLLIVDDDSHLLDSLRVVFKGLYEVHTVRSAEEAAEWLQHNRTDVLLLDVILPGMDGTELLKNLRESHPDLPVVMISAASSIHPVMKALELGACDYIRKPFDIDELRLIVSRALQTGQLRCQLSALERELARRPVAAEPGERPMKEQIETFERILIEKALQNSGGVQTRAAKMLGVTRRILRYRIEKLGL